jgi:hypothetical protein
MECSHDKKLLEVYFDGETTEEESLRVESVLQDCDPCQNAFAEMAEIKSALLVPMEKELQEVDFGAMWKNIESEISTEVPVRKAIESPSEGGGLWNRLQALFAGQPLVSLGAMALLITLVVVGSEPGVMDGAEPVDGGDISVAQGDEVNPLKGAAETLTTAVESNLAFVSGVEYESGTVFVDQDLDDPAQPLIVWHIEGEGASASQGG